MIKLWELTPSAAIKQLTCPDNSSLDSLTRLLPVGVYTTFRTFGNGQRVLGLRAHLERLYTPAKEKGVTPVVSVEELRRLLSKLLTDFGREEARVRLILTLSGSPGHIFAALEPLPVIPQKLRSLGVAVITVDLARNCPKLKATDFIEISNQVRAQISSQGVYEALLTKNGRILEGMTSNFFYVRNGTLHTASRGVLLGVTRSLVLLAAKKGSIKVVYATLPIEDISSIEEAFITSSSRGVMPVTQIDGKKIGQGKACALTRHLASLYQDLVLSASEEIFPQS